MALVPIEARVDSTELAQILLYFDKMGIIIDTKSELLRMITSMLATVLIDSGKVDPISEEDGLRIIKTRFVISDRGKRSIQRALQGIHISEDSLDVVSLPTMPASKKMMDDAMEAMRRFREDEK
jgi:hypothetical protein